MKTQEFEYEFDISWNNIMSNQAPGMSPYDKSIFLTQAQEAVVKGIYNGTLTNSFESTEEARSYLTTLLMHGYPKKLDKQDKYPHITKGTILYDLNTIEDSNNITLPKPWFITYEGVIFNAQFRCNEEEGVVKPVTHDTFWEIKRNPFRRNNDRRVLRLTYQQDKDTIAELVTEYLIKDYFIRYIRKPRPIILTDLSVEGLTIDGEDKPIGGQGTNVECCELNENLHRVILDMAVKLAKQAWVNLKTKDN